MELPSGSTAHEHNQQLLNGVQRLANALIRGAIPSTQGPRAVLEVITGDIPITYWLEKDAAKGSLRLEIHGHWQHSPPWKPSVRLTSHVLANEKLLKNNYKENHFLRGRGSLTWQISKSSFLLFLTEGSVSYQMLFTVDQKI